MKSTGKLAQKYTFSLTETKKQRGLTGSNVDFENMNKGFYDEIESKDEQIKLFQNALEKAKAYTIKESYILFHSFRIYSNKGVPDTWRTKLTYPQEMFKIIKEDQQFLKYLGMVGSSKDEKEKCIQIQRARRPKQEEPKDQSPRHLDTSPCHETQKNDSPERQSLEGSSKSPARQVTHFSVNEDDNKSEQRKSCKTKTFRTKHHFDEKLISNILEEYRSVYPFKDFTEHKSETHLRYDKNTEHKQGFLLPTIDNLQSTSKSKMSTYSLIQDEKMKPNQKSLMFKTSIYNKLIPNRSFDITEQNFTRTAKTKSIQKKESEIKTKFGPYLNFDYEAFNKIIEIQNPKVKKKLEDINYYGPYFSHCPSCRNKNLEFYQTLELNQCLKLLHYIKKVRIKGKELVDDPNNKRNILQTEV